MYINLLLLFVCFCGCAAFGLFVGILFSAREASKSILSERDRAMIYKDRADKLEGIVEDLRVKVATYESIVSGFEIELSQIKDLHNLDKTLNFIGTKLDESQARINNSIPGSLDNSYERGIRHALQIMLLHFKGVL